MSYTNLEIDFKSVIRHHQSMIKQINMELSNMPDGTLTFRKSNGKIYYCHNVNEKRIGITKNDYMVSRLARKKYLLVLKNKLQNNLALLKRMQDGYISINPTSIIQQMPTHFRTMPMEVFLPHEQSKNKWMNESFNQSTYNLEEKTHVTAKGLWVRSKSEVIIAEKLDAYEIPYRYEEILRIDNRNFVPDFTILTKDGIKYWEHCGLINDYDYMQKHRWKIAIYENAGIVPWKNLIVTYDNEYGSIDSRIIESEIKNKLL